MDYHPSSGEAAADHRAVRRCAMLLSPGGGGRGWHTDNPAQLQECHGGQIVNTRGDAVIAEFARVLEVVQCAVEAQQELSAQDPGALSDAALETLGKFSYTSLGRLGR